MHSALMRDYSPNISSAPLNAIIVLLHLVLTQGNELQAIQRRYQNLYLDQARQSQYEMLLGLDKDNYFPSMVGSTVECVSKYPSWCIKSLPSILSNVSSADILLQDSDNF